MFVAMGLGGADLGMTLLRAGIPYGDWVGMGIGAIVVFVAFTALYRRYDASFDAE